MPSMSQISEQIMAEMKEAMKAKQTVVLNALRALKSAMTNAAIEKGNLHAVLTESEELAVIRKQLKQREDSVDQFKKAGREDLISKEEEEIVVIKRFLPAELSEEETIAILDAVVAEIGATSKKEMGQVMKLMQERTAGRVNGKLLAQLVAKKLS